MTDRSGTARTPILVALAAAGLALVVGLLLLATGGGETPVPDTGSGTRIPIGSRPDRADTDRRSGAEDPEEDDEEEDENDGIVGIGLDRTPSGPVIEASAERLNAAIDPWHRETVMWCIRTMQEQGGTVPPEIVQRLIEQLDQVGMRLDAVAALGLLADDASGQTLATLASDPARDEAVRNAALDALAVSGQKAALDQLRALLTMDADAGVSDRLKRHALPALAAVGGQEAALTLIDFLLAHRDQSIAGAAITALAGTRGSGAAIAGHLRTAAEAGEDEFVHVLMQVAHVQGPDADDDLRGLLTQIARSPESFTTTDQLAARQGLQGRALSALAAMGEVRVVLETAAANPDLRGMAYHSLLQARGDDAAKALAGALAGIDEEGSRRQIVEALGRTGSREATTALVAALDDESVNVRSAAARGLSQVRDPAAADAILAKLDRADYQFSQHLIEALGTSGSKKALKRLYELWENEEPGWDQLEPWIRRAIYRIETGNPDAERLAAREGETESRSQRR